MTEDYDIGAPLPEESGNRTFVIAAAVLGGLLIIQHDLSGRLCFDSWTPPKRILWGTTGDRSRHDPAAEH